MSEPAEAPPADVADWSCEGPPRSRRHGDVYFSAHDGLAEARTVFLEGCGLPQAWAGRTRFCVGELGLGAGLNLVALLDLWRRTSSAEAHLHVFTVENDLMTANEVARALAGWPEVADIAGAVTAAWPGRVRGFRRMDLPHLRATVDVAQLEAADGLQAWSGAADAWFLDGFSPALDGVIWRGEVLDLVARRSASGARAATYTIAGVVRRGLAEAGFEVARKPGHGRKRERLEARLPPAASTFSTPARRAERPRTAIIGAGIAGASLRRALAAQGHAALMFEAGHAGAGASGVPAALAAPRLDAGLGPIAELFAQAAARAADLYDATSGAVLARGVLQLGVGARDPERFAAITGSDLFEPGTLARVSAGRASERLGEPVPEALDLRHAPVVDPAAILAAWAPAPQAARVARLEYGEDGWRLLGEDGGTLALVDAVCVAAGVEAARLAAGLPLTPVRGQTGVALGVDAPAASFGGYVTPTRDGALFGATHDRDDEDARRRPQDEARNLAAIGRALPELAGRLAAAQLSAWAGVRAATPDYLPLAGAVAGAPAGLFVLGGLGSRGFSLAPLLGEHVAGLILGLPSPLPGRLAALVEPSRFAARAARRSGGRPQPGRD
jgi:tRNA 5-methylaminomethyl-2-thiouridine biosynthesis bifunctional protein